MLVADEYRHDDVPDDDLTVAKVKDIPISQIPVPNTPSNAKEPIAESNEPTSPHYNRTKQHFYLTSPKYNSFPSH